MSTRRRNAYMKYRKGPARESRAPEKDIEQIPAEERQTRAASEGEHPGAGGYLPVAVVMEILAREYSDNPDRSLCRAALRLAEESGAIKKYRLIWDNEESSPGPLSSLLFDRNQCLELIKYHEKKGGLEALKRETEKLRQIEGRLLLGGVPQAKVTNEDLARLEEFIKEHGF